MYLKVIVLSGLLLLSAAACQDVETKTGDDGGAAAQARPASSSAADSAAEAAPGEASKEVLEGGSFSEEETAVIEQALLAKGEELGVQFDESTGVFHGGGLPESGVSLSTLVEDVKAAFLQQQMEVNEYNAKKLSHHFITRNLPPPDRPEPPKPTPKSDGKVKMEGSKPAEKVPDNPNADRSQLKAARHVLGDWRSTKEIHSRFTAEHDDDYYEFLTITNNGDATFMVYRDGGKISHRTFSYSHNEKSGKINLMDSTGKVVNNLVAYNMADDIETMYLEYPNGTMTVFEQISRVGIMPTDEEVAAQTGSGVGQDK